MCHQISCGCEQPFNGIQNFTSHQSHCCCSHNRAPHRFPTRQEVREELTEYLQQLKAEAKGVEEKLAEMETGS
jgi:hypothetical protein